GRRGADPGIHSVTSECHDGAEPLISAGQRGARRIATERFYSEPLHSSAEVTIEADRLQRSTCGLFTRFVGTPVEEGSDFLPVDAVIAVLVDGVEDSLDKILNLDLRKRTIAVAVDYGEHHSHPCAMHHPAPHLASVLPSEIAMPTIATSPLCSGAAMLRHSLLQHLSHHLTHHLAHGVFGWPAWRRL
ncbi:hypothetical protein, partial [Mesorhizobium sp.]|uniref:hypothetical protein n=1 Tax=Mesorhizobium sp. TaxID=1871066 RepID=UPI00257BA379